MILCLFLLHCDDKSLLLYDIERERKGGRERDKEGAKSITYCNGMIHYRIHTKECDNNNNIAFNRSSVYFCVCVSLFLCLCVHMYVWCQRQHWHVCDSFLFFSYACVRAYVRKWFDSWITPWFCLTHIWSRMTVGAFKNQIWRNVD